MLQLIGHGDKYAFIRRADVLQRDRYIPAGVYSVAGDTEERREKMIPPKSRAMTFDGRQVCGWPHPTSLGNWMMRDETGTGYFVDPDTIKSYEEGM